MGKEFRRGHYLKSVAFGKRTIKDGEAAVIWNRRGVCKEVIGPSLKRLWFSNIKFLDQFTAAPGQYLVISYKDGRKEHVAGPSTLYHNPVKYTNIEVKSSIPIISKHHCVRVIQHATGEKLSMQGRIVVGPAKFVPHVDEEIVPFQWISLDNTLSNLVDVSLDKRTVQYIGRQRLSAQIHTSTSDNLKCTVDLSMGFYIDNIEVALTFKDPLLALWEALQSDVAAITLQYSGEEIFNRSNSHLFTKLEEFKSLNKMAKEAAIVLTDIQRQGVAEPTEIRRAREAQIRSETEHAIAIASTEKKNAVAEAQLTASASREKREHELAAKLQENKIALEARQHETRVRQLQEENSVIVDFLKQLNNLGVDLTKYLVGKEDRPGVSEVDGVVTKASLKTSESERRSSKSLV